jgi:drug/metabolite transporter (DMT)-like permease
MLVVIYSLIAAVLAGLHIFSLKFLEKSNTHSYYLLVGVIALSIISRYSIYRAMKYTSNPTIVHIFLNFSVFVTFFLSVWLLNITDFNIQYFLLGLLFISIGGFLIQYSYKVSD